MDYADETPELGILVGGVRMKGPDDLGNLVKAHENIDYTKLLSLGAWLEG